MTGTSQEFLGASHQMSDTSNYFQVAKSDFIWGFLPLTYLLHGEQQLHIYEEILNSLLILYIEI